MFMCFPKVVLREPLFCRQIIAPIVSDGGHTQTQQKQFIKHS